MSKKRFLTYLGAAAVVTAYSAVKGKGIFNHMRFKNEHDAIARYVEGNYPGAVYSPVQQTELGYSVVIKRPNKSRVLLYVMTTGDGNYVFKEVT
jgi:hypothetical protein